MSLTASGDAEFHFVIRNGNLIQKKVAGLQNDPQTNTKASSASSLVKRYCQNDSTSNAGSAQNECFRVFLHDDHLRITSPTSAALGREIIIEGTWSVRSSSENTNNPDHFSIDGEDMLLGFLLEATIAQKNGNTAIDLDRAQILNGQFEKLSQLIRTSWWHNLTRSIQISNAALSKIDTKVSEADPRPRIYIPRGAPEQYQYYTELSKIHPELRLDIQSLPDPPLTSEYIQSLDKKPGLLALAVENGVAADGSPTLVPLPYVVPGGRFNELYGWDTYFTVLGLLEHGLTDLCVAMLKNFCFCIQHYGKIFNANRTYYLGRSQPPFLTSMGAAICQKLGKNDSRTLELAKLTLFASIKEYHTVWMAGQHYDRKTGLSRYFGEGKGFPPEVEPHHYDDELGHLAAKHNMSLASFAQAYNGGDMQDDELDDYLKHDRAGRESGHDTTYRFVGRAANLATVDLNSCLHKYETDIASLLDTYFDGTIEMPHTWQGQDIPKTQESSSWSQRATNRCKAMTQYLWCSERGLFFDYDTIEHVQVFYENATALWPLWANVASPSQAESIVIRGVPELETHGGLMASTESSRGKVSPARPQRQWDFPYGWAPHQMLAWVGLRNYGFDADAERLIYRWISMVTKTFVDYNGLVVEKYDVTSKDRSHVVEAEYGNQGSDFSSDVQTGFAWTNASLVYGANMLREHRP